jgi:CHAT domain-containing protein
VENYAVSYTYSARYLLNNFATNSEVDSRSFIGIAPVRYSNGLAALPGSDESLQRMEKYFRRATTFIRDKATKNNFLREYYKYKIIQLYTHATDSGSAGEPMIYFSDSSLALSDLFYENKPTTSLIVLSACETAGGKLYNGEGVFSFNRQFAALGIPSSVSNLWQVNNESSYRLMELFYKYLSKGEPPDVALQSAKREFIHGGDIEYALPFYWAAPILIGKTDSISLQRPFPWRWSMAIAFMAVIIFFGWQIARKKSRKKTRHGSLA